jgi:anthranilate/para-aminobenzoate synthase component II
MLLLIDNYDSFTYNLVHYLGELGADVRVVRNDALSVQEAIALRPQAIVLSPGPCDPASAGICVPLTRAAASADVPLLGVCLGHQTIGEAFGGRVIRCHEIVHGKMGAMHHAGAIAVAQLDVNWSYPKFVTVEPEGGNASTPKVTAIIDGFDYTEDDYVRKPMARDFFYLTRKAPEASPPPGASGSPSASPSSAPPSVP